ncbi:hypothetical protein TRVL_01533 [Trypanosoma vivax]|uniref:Uncharacterized protein n=1 Tax=Trypanosoma vivax (strain Y486) TaxID=1055687 RepID=G0U6R2_TRYVY|nr:hypothetical protein TRVL_01533 [Trypanosoma vivax]CCC51566.1 conserved hypothetical protein [Trypanosoma vivax Y486]
MFRRLVGSGASGAVSTLRVTARRYTNYDHFHYPADTKAVACVLGYFLVLWFIFMRVGSLFTMRSEYKKDLLRVWGRKLGTGYQWSDAWGPQIDTFFRNVPDSVE